MAGGPHQGAGLAVVVPHVYGEKPEEVEGGWPRALRFVSPCYEPLRQAAAGRWGRGKRCERGVAAGGGCWDASRVFSGVALPRRR